MVVEAADNVIKMAYNFTTVSQTVVFNSAMQSGGTLQLSAQIADGGGRNPGDPLTLKLVFYNSSNQAINTVQQAYTLTPGAAASTYSVTATNCGGSCASVAYVSVQFYGKDGGYWAGNYGPNIQSPVLSFNGGSNILYNPEFGIYSGNQYAQGWASTAGWQNCALYSGAATCVINNGATVNGGTYSATGGTTSGSSGGYTAQPPAPTYSSGITTAQQTRKTNETAQRQAQSGNEMHIEQIGDNNSITIRQGVTAGGKNRIELYSNGNYNTLNLNQGYTSSGTTAANDSNNHYLNLNLMGNNNSVTKQQTGTGNFAETTISGNSNNILNVQQGAGGKVLFQSITGNSNTVTTNQKDSGQHYLDLKLTGNGHSVTATQEGTGNHAATIDLTNSGGASSVNLNQSGSTGQVYSIQQSCTNPAGCSTTVTQP
jgi:hypothetical protein